MHQFCHIIRAHYSWYCTHILGASASRELKDVAAEEQGESAEECEPMFQFAALSWYIIYHNICASKIMCSNLASLIDLPGGCFYMGSNRGLFKEVRGHQLISYAAKRGSQSYIIIFRVVINFELSGVRCTWVCRNCRMGKGPCSKLVSALFASEHTRWAPRE